MARKRFDFDDDLNRLVDITDPRHLARFVGEVRAALRAVHLPDDEETAAMVAEALDEAAVSDPDLDELADLFGEAESMAELVSDPRFVAHDLSCVRNALLACDLRHDEATVRKFDAALYGAGRVLMN